MRATKQVPLSSARSLVESVEALECAGDDYLELLWNASDRARALHAWRVARVCNWLGYHSRWEGTCSSAMHRRASSAVNAWLHDQEVMRL